MKGAFLISADADLFAQASTALLQLGAQSAGDFDATVQLRNGAGRLFTLFGRVAPGYEWEFREGRLELGSGTAAPDMTRVMACPIECRWEDFFVWAVAAIARRVSHPCWVLDGNGVIWAADSIDVERLQL